MSTTPDIDPALLESARASILASMRHRHTIAGNTAWALFAGGLVLLVVVGWFIALGLSLIHSMFAGWYEGWDTSTYFILFLAFAAVWIVLQERRTREGFFSFASSDVDLVRDREDTAEYLIRRGQTHLTSLWEYILWTPRAIIAGYRGLRGVPQRGLDQILPDASDTLTRMMSIDAGMKISALAMQGEDPMMLMPILKWLDAHDYIGFSTRGDRVWVSSTAKKRFADEGIIVPKANAVVQPGGADATSRSGRRDDDEGPIELA